MKQKRKSTILKIALISALVAILATAFVACGGNGENGDNKINGDINNENEFLFTESNIEASIGYLLSNSASEPEFSFSYGEYGSQGMFAGSIARYEFSKNDNIMALIIIYRNTDGPKYFLDYIQNSVGTEEYSIKTFDNIVLLEKEPSFISNVIMKSKIPANSISKQRLDFIYEAYSNLCDSYENNSSGSCLFTYCVGAKQDYFNMEVKDNNFNISTKYYFSNISYDFEEYYYLLTKLESEYTDDSYIDFDREKGYVFAKLIEKSDAK